MFTAISPALRSSGQFLAPIIRAAGRDAIKHTTEAVIIYGGVVTIGAVGIYSYVGARQISRVTTRTLRRLRKPARLLNVTNIDVPTFAYEMDLDYI